MPQQGAVEGLRKSFMSACVYILVHSKSEWCLQGGAHALCSAWVGSEVNYIFWLGESQSAMPPPSNPVNVCLLGCLHPLLWKRGDDKLKSDQEVMRSGVA